MREKKVQIARRPGHERDYPESPNPTVTGLLLPDELPPSNSKAPIGNFGLNRREIKFCELFLTTHAGVGWKAARDAGYTGSAATLRVKASKILHRPQIAKALEFELSKRNATIENIQASLMAIAQGTAANYLRINKDGRQVADLRKMAKAGALGLIESLEMTPMIVGGKTRYEAKIKTYSRLRALEILAKIHGMIKEHATTNNTANVLIQNDPRIVIQAFKNNPAAFAMADALQKQLDTNVDHAHNASDQP